MFRRVAIIGGGAAAATLLGELLERRSPQPLHLDWFTGGCVPARGVAYANPSPRLLLHVRAASMSMFAGRPRGFLDFLQRDDPGIAGNDFVPRHRYGDYLESEVARAMQQGKAFGHDVHVLPFEVDALVPEHDGITLLHGEESRRVDAAVLALGELPQRPLPGVDAAALASGRYVVDPWPLLADVAAVQPPPREVVVLGLGLTAVDVLLELAAQWPQARFTTVSGHGVLPEAHRAAAAAPDDDTGSLIESLHDAPEIRRWVRLLREAAREESDWRSIVDSLRPHAPALWRELSHEQRARFLRHARWAWKRVRHRLPPQARDALTALEREGRLQRVRGRLTSATVGDGGLQLQVVHAGRAESLQAGLVVQATGLPTDVRHTAHRLVSQLVTNAHVVPDPLGLGVQADEAGRLRHGDTHWPHLFALGSLLRGSRWESAAMPEIRQQARSVAERLLAD